MEIEEKKITYNRLLPFLQRDLKEWWFSYVYDKKHDLYFSWSFVRTCFIDTMNILFFDFKNGYNWHFTKRCRLSKQQKKGELDLLYHKKHCLISYQGIGGKKRQLNVKQKNATIELVFNSTNTPPFIKWDNDFGRYYSLFHLFRQKASGVIKINNYQYTINTNISYYDHCFGNVPSRSYWHWLAAENDEFSIASLVNHGQYAQKYTQIRFGGEWIRLNQDVSFEYDWQKDFSTVKVTSPDIEIDVRIKGRNELHEQIFPLINLHHEEYCVEAEGRVRVDEEWREVKGLYGVLERHFGKW